MDWTILVAEGIFTADEIDIIRRAARCGRHNFGDLVGEAWLAKATGKNIEKMLVSLLFTEGRIGGKRGPKNAVSIHDLAPGEEPVALAGGDVLPAWRRAENDVGIVDSGALAERLGVTRRRAQQILAARVSAAREARQRELFPARAVRP
jgi:hypothetical protein